jgi:hypothetical protein
VNNKLRASLDSSVEKVSASTSTPNEKVIHDNTNEIIVLKSKISELEKLLKATTGAPSTGRAGEARPNRRKRYFSDSLDIEKTSDLKVESQADANLYTIADGRLDELKQEIESKNEIIASKEAELAAAMKTIREKEEEVFRSQDEVRGLKRRSESLVSFVIIAISL